MRSGNELRELFLAYFEEQAHRRVKSHSLIPPADPTLLFVNAGMVQFKDVFVGLKSVDYKRATTAQKCLRVSGKHNDLENVGRTARHHTFFEMLGNFSFGDYFKKDAIRFAYEFLTERVGLDKSKMYYTVFGGDPADGILPDDEARGYWKEVAGVDDSRILAFGKKDNFWSMGETGPCGPCSEILIDRGPGPWACGRPECAPGCDCDRYVEIWNLVFMQYERKAPGAPLVALPAPSIDTGMGLERLTCIVQGKATNYDTDLFMPLIDRTLALFQEQQGRQAVYGSDPEIDVALRVIADHSRSVAMLIADGVYPDNEGRGYIVRLLMRRAVRFGRKMGFDRPFFDKVCDAVVDLLSGSYPELEAKRSIIQRVVGVEEASFSQTYEEGRRSLEEEMARLGAKGEKVIGGDFLFLLHDERGFQPDLVEVIARESGFEIDRPGYEKKMEEKRQASGKADAAHADFGLAQLFRRLLEEKGPTQFVGYETEQASSHVVAIVANGQVVESLKAGERGQVLLAVSPFYAESGGQLGDTGTLAGEGVAASVTDTHKEAGSLWAHAVEVTEGLLKVGQALEAKVDSARRSGIRAHHSATHLLHWALEKTLGPHVKQEGSIVKNDLLRFDFRHFSPLTAEEIETIEEMIAAKVLENSPVQTRVMGIEEAVATGAKAFFDEKYGAQVRVVSMGNGSSSELCGGTHAYRTGDIGILKILKQEAISSGVRRVYAVCHHAYVAWARERERQNHALAAALRCPADEVQGRVQKTLQRVADLEKEVKELQKKMLQGGTGGAGGNQVESVGAFGFASALLPDAGVDAVRETADMLRDKVGQGVVMVGGIQNGKVLTVIAKTKTAPEAFHCGKAVALLAPVLGLRGGGKPDFAQAGGGDPAAWEAAVALIREHLKSLA